MTGAMVQYGLLIALAIALVVAAFTDLRRRQIVRDIEVEHATHDTGRHDQAEEAAQLRADPLIVCQSLEQGRPDGHIGVGGRGHGAPDGSVESAREA